MPKLQDVRVVLDELVELGRSLDRREDGREQRDVAGDADAPSDEPAPVVEHLAPEDLTHDRRPPESSTTTVGRCMEACTMPTFCRFPRESCLIGRSRTTSSRAHSSSRRRL
jgi:hypothetical protein